MLRESTGGVFVGANLNAYAYAHLNPVKFNDPDGNAAAAAPLVLAAVVLVGAANTTPEQRAQMGRALARAWENFKENTRQDIEGAKRAVDKFKNWVLNESAEGENGSSTAPSPEIKPEDLRGRTKEELERLAGEKGLVQDPKKPNKWRDPQTGDERIRIDPGHVDPRTGKPYDNERAAVPHVHGYDQNGNKIRDPEARNDPHFPLRPESTQ